TGEGKTQGTLKIARAGATIEVSEFSARSAAGHVSASGVLGLSNPGDLAMTVVLADSRPFATLVPDVTWSGATMRARVQGMVDQPHVTADLVVQGLASAGISTGTSKLSLDASAEQGFEQPVAIRADLQMSDLASSASRLTALLADGVPLT